MIYAVDSDGIVIMASRVHRGCTLHAYASVFMLVFGKCMFATWVGLRWGLLG